MTYHNMGLKRLLDDMQADRRSSGRDHEGGKALTHTRAPDLITVHAQFSDIRAKALQVGCLKWRGAIVVHPIHTRSLARRSNYHWGT